MIPDKAIGWSVIGYLIGAVTVVAIPGLDGFMGGMCVAIVSAWIGG